MYLYEKYKKIKSDRGGPSPSCTAFGPGTARFTPCRAGFVPGQTRAGFRAARQVRSVWTSIG
jgi:hypothetical protein